MRWKRVLAVAWSAMLGAAPLAAQAKGPFTAQSWADLRSAYAVAVAGDGTILYEVSHGARQGPTQTEWWIARGDGSHTGKLELPKGFEPMGFTRGGKSLYGAWRMNDDAQFAIFAVTDGKAAAAPSTVVVLPRGIEGALPSPDGKRFALTADPRPPDPMDAFRHVHESSETSLYVVNADGTNGVWWCGGLTHVSGMLTVGGGANAAAWNAGSDELAVLSQTPRTGHHDVAASIDVCSASGSRHVAEIPNSVNGITWIDGGREIAVLSTKSEVLTPEHVWTMPATGGVAVDRTPSLDGTAVQIAGDVEGRVWVLVYHGVQAEVDRFEDGALKRVYRWPEGTIYGVPVTPQYTGEGDHMAMTAGDPTHAANVMVPDGDGLKRITHEGDDVLASIELGPVRVVSWTSKQGIHLQGIATFPAGYVSGKKYPFVVLPHGGPEANDPLRGDPFSRFVAGLGYVVLQPEYRGSIGYGADFLAAIYQHFGDRAYDDVNSATDYAVAQGWADPNRLAIFGWSAGGFMTSWTVTQTGRYKAAIEGAGITDWSSFIWTSDVEQIDYDARWTDEDPQAFWRFSAMAYAYKVTTPLLILQGEADVRVPTYQGLEFFQILKARGKTVRMVTYPGSGHFPSAWEQRLDVMQEIADWLHKYNE
jgi:dipeptidyl aminopeptidase/acylaminoacyl peptidase